MNTSPEPTFSLDRDRLARWLQERTEELGGDPQPEPTFGDLAEEDLHRELDRCVYELRDAGILAEPEGWRVEVYALDSPDQWSYLVTVRPADDSPGSSGAGSFQIADQSEEVTSSTPVAAELEGVIETANRLLPLARAAQAAAEPAATAEVGRDGEGPGRP